MLQDHEKNNAEEEIIQPKMKFQIILLHKFI
jgi:hypothetical protein